MTIKDILNSNELGLEIKYDILGIADRLLPAGRYYAGLLTPEETETLMRPERDRAEREQAKAAKSAANQQGRRSP